MRGCWSVTARTTVLPEPDLLGAIEEFVTGSRSESADADRFLATVLFVDVVGSTQYASEFGDQSWRAALDRFEQAAADVLLHFEERSSVRPAMESWRRSKDPLAQFAARLISATKYGVAVSRSGAASMPARWRRPEGIAGLAVHIGARVCALAAPGEVLVTGTVRDLVAGSDREFEDRGARELKGVPGLWRLFSVVPSPG